MPARIILFVAVIALPFVSSAQGKIQNSTVSQNPVWFRAAYLGSMIYPGMALGIEYPVKTKYYLNGADSTRITKVKQRSLTGNFAWYHHKNYHDNFIFSTGYLMRRTNKKGWFADFEPQLGVTRAFISETVYTVDANNNVEQRRFAGDWFFVSKLSFTIGKDLSYKTTNDLPLKIYMRSSLITLLPYNNFIYARPTLEIGVIYSFNNAWMVRSKRSYIVKEN